MIANAYLKVTFLAAIALVSQVAAMWNPCIETTDNGHERFVMKKGAPQAQDSGESRQIYYELSSPALGADAFYYPNELPHPSLVINFHSGRSMIAIVKRLDHQASRYKIPGRTGCDIELNNSADLDVVELYSI